MTFHFLFSVKYFIPPAVVTIHGPVAALDKRTLSPSLWKEDGCVSGRELILDCES